MKVTDQQLIKAYQETGSSHKVAVLFKISRRESAERLKNLGVLRTKSQAASIRKPTKGFKRSPEQCKLLSDLAKARTGSKNHFFGKQHTVETKIILQKAAQKRTGKRNPNYKDGRYVRRPRDFKISEFQSIRNEVFKRDDYKCHYCQVKGKTLSAHHILPYWVNQDAYLDKDNVITVCKNCHFVKAHIQNWACFDINLVSDILITRYNLDRERLSEMAFSAKGKDAIVRTVRIS